MNKLLLALLIAGMSLGSTEVSAQTKPATEKKVVKKTSKAKAKAAAAAAAASVAPVALGDDEEEITENEIVSTTVTEFHCELGNKVTTYRNADDNFLAVRWNKRLHRLKRVGTSTGANRFENRRYGLVWISIPSKAMLLDSKKGQQLANECKHT